MPDSPTEATARSPARNGRVITVRTLAYLLTGLVLASLAAPLAGQHRSEAELKAAFLYHFGSYVEWPATAFDDDASPFVIGLVGAADVLAPLAAIARGRTVLERPVAVRQFAPGEDPGSAHILFIGEDVRPGPADDMLARARGLPVLMVTETVYVGDAAIRFVIEQDRVRFDVSLAAVHDAGLRMSSRLLAIARRVEGMP